MGDMAYSAEPPLRDALLRLMRQAGRSLSLAEILALTGHSGSDAEWPIELLRIEAMLRENPVFVRDEDGSWGITSELVPQDQPQPTDSGPGATASRVRIDAFPLFRSPGEEAKGMDDPDYARLPVDLDLGSLGLTPGIRESLETAGIRSVGDLLLTPPDRLREHVRFVGPIRLEQLREAVEKVVAGAADANAPRSTAFANDDKPTDSSPEEI